eukprot:4062210-Amphidinium_carterae.1
MQPCSHVKSISAPPELEAAGTQTYLVFPFLCCGGVCRSSQSTDSSKSIYLSSETALCIRSCWTANVRCTRRETMLTSQRVAEVIRSLGVVQAWLFKG